MITAIKIIIILISISFNYCEENNQNQNEPDRTKLKLIITTIAMTSNYLINTEDSNPDKIKFLMIILLTIAVSSMIGQKFNEWLYGSDPLIQNKIKSSLFKELEKLNKESDKGDD